MYHYPNTEYSRDNFLRDTRNIREYKLGKKYFLKMQEYITIGALFLTNLNNIDNENPKLIILTFCLMKSIQNIIQI